MPTIQRSLRVKEKTFKEIKQIAKESSKEFSTIVNDLLDEAVKMYHCPGIIFTEGTAGRRARIAGTGIEVWEVIAAYKSMGSNFKRLQRCYHWLTQQQLKAALGYYKAFTMETEHLIKQNLELTKSEVQKKYPFLNRNTP